MFKKIAIILSFLFVLAAGSSEAADFTINVYLDLKKLHSAVKKIKVECVAMTVENPAGQSSDVIIGSETMLIDVSSDGTVAVNIYVGIDASPGKDPAEAAYWRCFFFLNGDGFSMPPTAAGGDPTTSFKPGTPFTYIVTGAFQ